MKKESEGVGYAIGELLFILLPFVVMTIIYLYENKIHEILYEPEWSLASSVMFGQSIIKLIHTITKKNIELTVRSYNVGAALSAIIVLGLVPSLIVLSLIFTSKIIPNWLMITQIVLFLISVFVFSFVNKIQREIEEEIENK